MKATKDCRQKLLKALLLKMRCKDTDKSLENLIHVNNIPFDAVFSTKSPVMLESGLNVVLNPVMHLVISGYCDLQITVRKSAATGDLINLFLVVLTGIKGELGRSGCQFFTPSLFR